MNIKSLKTVLDKWQPDSAWINEALARARGKDLVSFDIFDTALTRDTDSPADVFARIEQELAGEDKRFCGFAAAREQAEQQARHFILAQKGEHEITLEEIYQQLPHFLPLTAAEAELAKSREYSVEAASLFAVPDILACARELRRQGMDYIFVSDMYLPAEFLAGILRREGFEGWQRLIVSSEWRRTKAAGNIWDISVLKGKNILHIGDNKKADIAIPQKRGIDALYYGRAQSQRRWGCELTPASLPFSVAHRSAWLESRAEPPPAGPVAAATREMYLLGRSLGLVMLGSFIFWLLRRAKVNKITHLAFCARDGWLTQKAWHILTREADHGISDSYIYVSRSVLFLGEAALTCTPDKVSDIMLDFLTQHGSFTTVEAMLKRMAALSPELAAKAAPILGRRSALMARRGRQRRLRELLQQESALLYKQFCQAHHNISGYFRQEGLASHKRLGMVDMGWNGRMQRGLARLCADINPDFSCVGFYYGLWSDAIINRYFSGPMEGAFFNEFSSSAEVPKIRQGVGLLENIHSAPEGTTKGYACKDGRWQPIARPAAADKDNYEHFIGPFQRGALEALQELADSGKTTGGLTAADLTPQAGYAAYKQLFLSPSLAEIEALGQIQHDPWADHQNFSSLVNIPVPRRQSLYQKNIESEEWRLALMRYWLIRARSPRERRHLRKFMKRHFAYLTPRELQYFK